MRMRDRHIPNTHHEHLVLHHRHFHPTEDLREPEQRPPVARRALREHHDGPVGPAPDLLERLGRRGRRACDEREVPRREYHGEQADAAEADDGHALRGVTCGGGGGRDGGGAGAGATAGRAGDGRGLLGGRGEVERFADGEEEEGVEAAGGGGLIIRCRADAGCEEEGGKGMYGSLWGGRRRTGMRARGSLPRMPSWRR